MVICMNQNQIKIMCVLGKKYKFLYLNMSKIYIYYNKQLKDNPYISMQRNKVLIASIIKFFKRGGAEEARWAHNPEDGGSKPFPAIYKISFVFIQHF